MSKPVFTSRFYAESGSESEPEPPPPPLPPRLTPQQKKKLERQRRFDDEQAAQKEAQAAEAKEREEANRRRREKKARKQKQEPAAGGGAACTPDRFAALAVLGLTPPQDNLRTINQAYRALALQHHPDKGGDPEICKRINVAHAFLVEEA